MLCSHALFIINELLPQDTLSDPTHKPVPERGEPDQGREEGGCSGAVAEDAVVAVVTVEDEVSSS